jgi:hypothetical protein
MTDYEHLKALGFRAAKAAEIILDAKRGDRYARQWVETARNKTRPT